MFKVEVLRLSKLQTNTITFNDSELHAVLINHTRYCLTRRSYAVSECCDLLKSKWSQVPVNTQNIIRRDIKEAIDDDDNMIRMRQAQLERDRTTESYIHPMNKCDRLNWNSILEFIS
jgi:hypothetical protein